ncbi:helix-turn-helix domain-containing protein [Streptomyces cinnamoneus]|uniref:AraC family transcriptional regulator n=1 Tax=Streptomyces cinnamoneus TaxID=53446 RepID=A0A918WEU6_STRCJ|nr:helix-turn-helix domain-containing protein [Streptomyces cinnamoneus]GHC41327.1 AraC family transcriptional regulator [Streptomyces cinnamoneus]
MLLDTEFRTDGLSPEERFDCWREHLSRSYAPADIISDHRADFPAVQRMLALGPVRLWTTEHPSMTLHRTPKLIRRSDPELYHLSLPLRGTMRVVRPGHEAFFGAYDIALRDTSRPYRMEIASDRPHGQVLGTGLLVPKKLLPLPEEGINRLSRRRIPGQEGMGALFSQLITRLALDPGSFRPDDGPRLGTVVVDMLCAVLASALEAEDSLSPEARRRTLVLRIQQFIQQHLHDPQLSPPVIAAAHHISTSYLHRLFQEEGTTVGARIRHERLEHIRRDLANPSLRSSPLHAIANRWGFPRAADFSRAFRAAYGMPPKDYRHQTLNGD